MAKIRTYETVTTPAAGDIVIGTDISDDNATKNFDVQDIANLAPTPTLNEVLGAGNTSALNITLSGSARITTPNLTVTADALITNLEVTSAFRDSTSSTGTSGQVLSSTGTATQWVNPIADDQTLDEVLTEGNTSAQDITLSGTATVTSPSVVSNNLTSNLQLIVSGTLADSTSSVGTAGQLLSSTGTATSWVDASTYNQTLDEVLTEGNTSGQNITLSGTASVTAPSILSNNITSQTQLIVSGTLVDGGLSTGTSGQVLSSTGTGTLWVDASTYNQNLNEVLTEGSTSALNITLSGSATITSPNLTVTADALVTNLEVTSAFKDSSSSAGTSGQVLSSTGTATSWITPENTFDVAHEIVGFSTAAQQGPSAVDTSYTVEFGAAQGSGATASQLSAAGVVTFNEAGIYRIDVQLAAYRPSGTGDAFLLIAPYLNGSQYGVSSVITFIPSQAQWQPWNYSVVVDVAATDTFTIRLARDGSGTNEGALARFSTGVGSPFTGPASAQIRIQQLKNV
jgi:CTP-dependent riboflavin kinase